jgi:hypothetical protein
MIGEKSEVPIFLGGFKRIRVVIRLGRVWTLVEEETVEVRELLIKGQEVRIRKEKFVELDDLISWIRLGQLEGLI